eukprot:8940284-Pyramimonas_sp.AAC.1
MSTSAGSASPADPQGLGRPNVADGVSTSPQSISGGPMRGDSGGETDHSWRGASDDPPMTTR